MLATLLAAVVASPTSFDAPSLRRFEVEQRLDVAPLSGGPSALFFVPLPQDDPWQLVTGLSIEGAAFDVVHDPREGNAAARLKVPAAGVHLVVRYTIQRRERSADLGAAEGTQFPNGYVRDLASDRHVPVELVRDIAWEIGADAPTPLGRARAVYDYVLGHMRYDKSGTGWGRGDVRWACDEHRGNCTDFHSLLIGLLRASGIPARFQIGHSLPDGPAGELAGYHCWADFYLPGSGWVPVDASEGWKHPEKRDFFFGHHDADRFAVSTGRDIVFPGMTGEPLNFFVFPYLEVAGKAAPGLVSRRATFRDLPPRASAAASQ